MKILKQGTKRALSLFLTFSMLLSLMVTGISAIEEGAAPFSTVDNAILYTVNASGQLEYNVVYKASVTADTSVTDSTGNGIDTLEELETVMGVADKPALALGTEVGTRTLGKAVTADLGLDESGNVVSISVTDVRVRPVVGISWKKDTIGTDYQGFAEAYERNGAYAVYLPQVYDAAGARTVLSQIDGIFFTGGEDWNPKLYGEIQTPHGSSGWNDPRDTSDINLMQQAVAMDVPLLAVCRGMQGFNVAMGGGLIQDIPYYLGQKVLAGEIDVRRVTGIQSGSVDTLKALVSDSDPEKNEKLAYLDTLTSVQDTGYTYYNENYEKVGKTYDATTGTYMEGSGCEEGHLRVQIDGVIHSGATGYHVLTAGNEGIGISADSKWMHDVAGSDFIDLVATAHHQAVNPEKLGNGLTIVASSTDGIVEGIEHQNNLFALAVQFHPERDALGDSRSVDLDGDGIKETPIDVDQDKCNAFLGALVKYAGIYSDRQNQTSDDDDSSSTGGSGNPTTPSVQQPSGGSFTDVAEGAWYRTAVDYVYEKGLMSGMGNDSFAPDTTLTRAMLAQMLYKLGGGQPGDSASFEDVDSNAWYAAAVNWAAAKGIVSGVGSGGFAPEASITREQLAVMLWKYAGAPVVNSDLLDDFTDAGEANDYAVQALAWAVENGIIAGQGNGTLSPGGQATRAQVAQMFMSYMEKQG